uniref:Cell division cycle 20B n=1 Tax=Paramormyrops kingsleyae TaxID=1676925 RepID=A0A3B3QKG3_9TELE
MEWKLKKYSRPKVKTEGAMVLRATDISYRRFKRRILSRLSTEFPLASSPKTTRWQHSYITENDTVCQRLPLDSPPRSTSLTEVRLGDKETLHTPDGESPLDLDKRGWDVSVKSLLEMSRECSRGQSDGLKVNEQDCIWKESEGDENPCSTPLPFSIIETAPSMPCSVFKAERQMAVPGLQDDYYLNLLAWSEQDMVVLGLASSVCIWNGSTQSLQGSLHLTPHTSDLFGPSSCPLVSSVAWSKDGQTLAIGKSDGEILLWDVERRTSLRKLTGHLSLVGSLSCNQYILSSGSVLGLIHHHDARVARPVIGWLRQKKGICGLAWCPHGSKLASGTTDGLLSIWPDDPGATGKCLPMLTISHPTAVKALAWCPWQLELVAVGGGRQDGALRVWDTHTGVCRQSVQTHSQICSLCWCPANEELLSGHGLPQHQITCWKMPSMSRKAELYGHRGRVLHLALSPCGTRIFTVGSDRQACVWKHSDQLIWPREDADGHYCENRQCHETL